MSELLGVDELRDAVRGVLADRAPDTIDIPDETGRGLDRALWQDMAALGWLGLAVPEDHGGLGLGAAHLAVLYEELGRHLGSVPIVETMIAANVIAELGDAAARERWLPQIIAGECLAAIALPGMGDVPHATPDQRHRRVDRSYGVRPMSQACC